MAVRAPFLLALLTCLTPTLPAQAYSGSKPAGFVSAYAQLAGPDDWPPIVMAGVDLSALHLEGRYNYEDNGTVSLWAGWNLKAGSALRLIVTPMAGAYAGQGGGAGPGLEFTLTWKQFTVYDESELIFPFSGDSSWIYTWATASWAVRKWFQPGVSIQRLWIPGGQQHRRSGDRARGGGGAAGCRCVRVQPVHRSAVVAARGELVLLEGQGGRRALKDFLATSSLGRRGAENRRVRPPRSDRRESFRAAIGQARPQEVL